MQQVTPYSCADCWAQQFNPYSNNSAADEDEKRHGWWKGPPTLNPYDVDPEARHFSAIKRGLTMGLTHGKTVGNPNAV